MFFAAEKYGGRVDFIEHAFVSIPPTLLRNLVCCYSRTHSYLAPLVEAKNEVHNPWKQLQQPTPRE